MDNTDSQLLVV